MTAILTPADHARLTEVIRAAETRTAGEIFVVVARSSGHYALWGVFWAAIVALLLPWPFYLAGWPAMPWPLLLQGLGFVVLALAFSQPRIAVRLAPDRVRTFAARRAALEQFLAHGIHTTQSRTGVLIYLSLAERDVEIIADKGINDCAPDGIWNTAVEAVRDKARAGDLVSGVEAAIAIVGEALAQHWPAGRSDTNELADRVVEL